MNRRTLAIAMSLVLCFAPCLSAQTSLIRGSVNGTSTQKTVLVDSAGHVVTVPNASYSSVLITGSVAIPLGSTVTVTTLATFTTSLVLSNDNAVGGASVMLNVLETSGSKIVPTSFVIPAGQQIGLPLGSGQLYTGIYASSSSGTGGSIRVVGYTP